VLAALLGRDLIRLQCYEGIDASQALYEWNYSRQLIAVRAMQDVTAETHVEDLFGPEFLVERPLLAAIRAGSRACSSSTSSTEPTTSSRRSCSRCSPSSPSRSPRSVPSLRRSRRPSSSPRTHAELHDALKRRCLYH